MKQEEQISRVNKKNSLSRNRRLASGVIPHHGQVMTLNWWLQARLLKVREIHNSLNCFLSFNTILYTTITTFCICVAGGAGGLGAFVGKPQWCPIC